MVLDILLSTIATVGIAEIQLKNVYERVHILQW